MAQGSQFPLRKPPGFHYDFFLLGITTFIAGLLGVPAPNGLIPQAPIHTTSLLVMGQPTKKDLEGNHIQNATKTDFDSHKTPRAEKGSRSDDIARTQSRRSHIHIPHITEKLEPDPTHAHEGEGDARQHEVPIAVVEQRVSNLAQGSLCLVLLTGPFLHVLNLIPRGVLAGLL